MIAFIKKNYHYFLIFILIFCMYNYLFIDRSYADPINNYGFSYALKIGEIPYKDFNLLTTPLYAFIMSLGLFIWDNYFMFLLEQSLLVTIAFYFLNKLFGSNCYLLLLISIILGSLVFNPTYNFMVFLLIIILLYLEKNNKNDYLIGLTIGLSILCKHTVGLFLIIPSLIFYFKDKDKIIKRIIGIVVPCFIFIIYLLITKSFYNFFDLAFLGLFDFANKNGLVSSIWFYFSIVLLIVSLIKTIKDKSNILNYYYLLTFTICIPIFDLCHVLYFILFIVMQFLPYSDKKSLLFLYLLLSYVMVFIWFIQLTKVDKFTLNKGINKFQYTNNYIYHYDMIKKNHKFISKYKNPIVLSSSHYNIMYKISNNKKIDYFDILHYSNFGYNGDQKMINRIKKMHNKYIIIDMIFYESDRSDSQYDKNIVKYIIDNYDEVCENESLHVYYLK